MSGIVYDIDALLEENRPKIRFRKKEYYLKERTVKEMMKDLRSVEAKGKKIEEKRKERVRQEVIDDGFEDDSVEEEVEKRLAEMTFEEQFQDYLPIAIEDLKNNIEGLPDDIDENLTVEEFKLLRSAIEQARSQEYVVKGKKEDDDEKKR